MRIAHFGTFDVQNYGDLLYPLLVERRLRQFGWDAVHVAPTGRKPNIVDAVQPIDARQFFRAPSNVTACMIGGGHIVRLAPTTLQQYVDCDLSATAYPLLWLYPAGFADAHELPLVWNAPGVAHAIRSDQMPLIQSVLAKSSYVSVRDSTSQKRLEAAGKAVIHEAPDPALDLPLLWSKEQLRATWREVQACCQLPPGSRVLAVHVSQHHWQGQLDTIARELESLSRSSDCTILLLPLRICHGDQLAIARIQPLLPSAVAVPKPISLRRLAASIACATAYVGTSLHGALTAIAYGRPAVSVIPRSAATAYKFSDLADRYGGQVVPRWSAVSSHLRQAMSRDPTDGSTATTELDRHWQRLYDAMHSAHAVSRFKASGRSRTVSPGGKVAGENKVDLTSPCLDRLLKATAVNDLADEALRLRQRVARLSNQVEALKLTATEQRDAAETAKQRIEYLKRAQQSLQNTAETSEDKRLRLESCFDSLRFGIEQLLSSRRWRLGDAIGRWYQRLTLQPQVPMATDFLEDVFCTIKQLRSPEAGRMGGSEVAACSLPEATATKLPSKRPELDIVICVHNALEDVRRCLESLFRCTRAFRLILVDDGSDPDCAAFLRSQVCQGSNHLLITNSSSIGYTRSANLGLRHSRSPAVALLNSDTIVTPGWLDGLYRCLALDAATGLVGPLSNAASWQSVPDRFQDADWAVNALPRGMTACDLAEQIRTHDSPSHPAVDLLNGFCLLVHRDVLTCVGYFDEESFPEGYGEETDYCNRTLQAGWSLRVADDVYVFHAKSKSYSHARRRQLSLRSQQQLRRLYGKAWLSHVQLRMTHNPALAAARQRVAAIYANASSDGDRAEQRTPDRAAQGQLANASNGIQYCHAGADEIPRHRWMFLAPVAAGGGGVHSIVQEARAMRRLGVDCGIAIPSAYRASYLRQYPNLTTDLLFRFYDGTSQLLDLFGDVHLSVCTIYHSVALATELRQSYPCLKVAYYVQDYEPWFHPAGSANRLRAEQSYSAIKDMILFAKTDWLCSVLREKHGCLVEKVPPSLDLQLFHPRLGKRASEQCHVTAMLRPRTPRRAAKRTVAVLRELFNCDHHPPLVTTFGCREDELSALGGIPNDRPWHHLGRLSQQDVSELFRRTDVFVDFSDYQAFGRTALEAMACGNAVVVPRKGGATEYAVDEVNALLIETSDFGNCLAALRRLVEDARLRRVLSSNAIETATNYSLPRSAVAIASMLMSSTQGQSGTREECQPLKVI